MSKVSVIIPARSEKLENICKTLDSILDNARGEYEVIIGFDGESINKEQLFTKNGELFSEKMELKIISFPSTVGIKTNLNAMAAMATGKYLYKSDAHCKFSKGFDEILQQDMQEDWIVTPRFYVLDGQTWEWQDDRFYDYFYLCCPFTDPKGFRFKAGGHWPERTQERLVDTFYSRGVGDSTPWPTHIDETPQIHGSGWFMTRDRYFELGGFPNIDPSGHAQEPIWLALKNWLAGGKVMVNKNCWYAHMHKNGDKDRGYHIPHAQNELSYKLAADFFVGDKPFEGRKHNFEWFIDKFMPMPTWPENWRELLHKWQEEHK